MSTTFAGTYAPDGAKMNLAQTCPTEQPTSPGFYTASGDTIVFYGTKQDYKSGGCQWFMQYELVRQ